MLQSYKVQLILSLLETRLASRNEGTNERSVLIRTNYGYLVNYTTVRLMMGEKENTTFTKRTYTAARLNIFDSNVTVINGSTISRICFGALCHNS